MTMKTKVEGLWAAIAILTVFAAIGWATATNGKDSQSATCPDGQSLAVSQVNGDTFSQSKPPPPGAHYSDSVSGSGLDYTLNSDNDSATLKVHGKGTATLYIACR